jgi:hypothetical protein
MTLCRTGCALVSPSRSGCISSIARDGALALRSNVVRSKIAAGRVGSFGNGIKGSPQKGD